MLILNKKSIFRSSCADQEQQQQLNNTTAADNNNSCGGGAVDHNSSRPPAVIVSSLPSPSDSVLSAPLPLNLTSSLSSSCSTSSLPTTPTTPSCGGTENQVGGAFFWLVAFLEGGVSARSNCYFSGLLSLIGGHIFVKISSKKFM